MEKNGCKLYPALELEIFNRGIKKADIAKSIGVKPNGITDRLNGTTSFKLEESIKIWNLYFSDTNFTELFKRKEV